VKKGREEGRVRRREGVQKTFQEEFSAQRLSRENAMGENGGGGLKSFIGKH